jgi:hypothetical protein
MPSLCALLFDSVQPMPLFLCATHAPLCVLLVRAIAQVLLCWAPLLSVHSSALAYTICVTNNTLLIFIWWCCVLRCIGLPYRLVLNAHRCPPGEATQQLGQNYTLPIIWLHFVSFF